MKKHIYLFGFTFIVLFTSVEAKGQMSATADLKYNISKTDNFWKTPTPIYTTNLKNKSSSLLLPNKCSYEAFFCKIEYEANKSSKIQLKARLGTVEYVDRLEGKD